MAPVKLKLLPRSTLKAKNVTNIVGQVTAGDGITVTKGSGNFEVALEVPIPVGSLSTGTSGYALIANGAGVASAYQGFTQAGTDAITRTWQAKLREVEISVRDYRAVSDTDDTLSFTRAITYLTTLGGGTIRVPSERVTTISSKISVPAASAVHVRIKGDGGFASRIKRATTYTGAVFEYNGSTSSNCTVIFEDLFFYTDYSTDTAPTAGTIVLKNGGAQGVLIAKCHFWDQQAAIDIDAMANVRVDSCRIWHSSEAAALDYAGTHGIYIHGSSVYEIFITNTTIWGQNPTAAGNLQYGVLIAGADGVQIQNCAITAHQGIVFQADGTAAIDDVYVSNTILDNCNYRCVQFVGTNAPRVFTNFRFDGCHIDVGGSTTGTTSSSVVIEGDADRIQFNGCNIGNAEDFGVYIEGSVNNWNSIPKQAITLTDCHVSNNNRLNTAGRGGIHINAPGVSVIGGASGNITTAGRQKYGVAIGAAGDNCSVIGVNLRNNDTSTHSFDAGASNLLFEDCAGYHDTLTGLIARQSSGVPAARTITGTSNRLTVSNGTGASGDPTLDISSSYVGQNTITTLGTVTTGVWNGTTISVGSGGTGAATLTGLLQGNGTSAFTAITNSSTTGQVLRVTGASAYGWGALNLASSNAVTGTLPVGNGGTGAATLTGLLQGSGTSAFAAITDSSTVGQVLRVTGTSTYAWGAVNLASTNAVTGTLPVGNGGTGITSLGSGVATFLGTPSSANLAAALTDETGSGAAVFATSPTLVTPTLGVASATSINFGGTALANYAEGTWTPSDASGASLSLSSVAGIYTRIGRTVIAHGSVTYPSTADGSSAKIGSLPFTANGSGAFGAVIVVYTTTASASRGNVIAGTQNLQFSTTTGGIVINSQLSTLQIIFTAIYQI